jgi:fumarate reductase flavoprotein subunit
LLCGTTAKKVLTDKQGRVTGVLASAKKKQLQISTGNVIIGTGGYGGNKELLKKYNPHYTEEMKCGGLAHTGDGILMAWEAGADSEGMGILQLVGPDFAGAGNLGAVATEPNTIWVNKNGERFTDETTAYNIFESVNTLLRQPDKVCYSLFDENVPQGVINEGIIKGAGIMIVPPGLRIPDLDEKLRLEADNGRVKIADSWDDIAGWMGVAPEVLQHTVDEYNSYCDQGYDEVFAKDRRYLMPLRTPPYYAMECHIGFLGTIGGIKINHRMEVINKQGKPIPGLYAIGVDTGGWESETYCGILAGSCFGFAMNSGRIAAENVVKSLS